MVCSISCALPLDEICHTNNKQASSNNKNKKNKKKPNQVHLKQAHNQSSSNKITITQHHTHSFQPQCPKHYCWWSLRCRSLFPVSHGIAAARALQPILLNEAAVPGARLTPHKQRMCHESEPKRWSLSGIRVRHGGYSWRSRRGYLAH